MKKSVHATIAFLVFVTLQITLSGQNLPAFQCASEEAMQLRPELLERQQLLEKAILQNNKNGELEKSSPPPYTLPVVVHIIHDNGVGDIPDAQVFNAIELLNQAYAHQGYYADQGAGYDTQIQFCLAKRDPDGNATNGITRTSSPLTNMNIETEDLALKNLSRWNPYDYINIWVVNAINSLSSGPGVIGYAYLASAHGQPFDGMVCEAGYFGASPERNVVAIHEMGHYLNLYHTFQGGCPNGNCLTNGDRVCDTPPDQVTFSACGFNSCDTDTDDASANNPLTMDVADMTENYMDYSPFSCYHAFTAGQAQRMYNAIESVRKSLLESQGCVDACMSPIDVNFVASTTNAAVGEVVNFTNMTSGGTSYEWKVDGVVFSNGVDANYSFDQGVFEVCLQAGNADPNCSDQFCLDITVTCPVQAAFSTNVLYPKIGEPVDYVNNSMNAQSYEWTLNGTVISTAPDLTWTFVNQEIYDLCLTATNGLCSTQYCLPVFVTNGGSNDCDGSYLKYFGEAGLTESSNTIVATANGSLLIGGQRGNASLLSLVSPNGDLLIERTIDVTNGGDFLQEIMIDSEGMLVGIGRDVINAATVNFIFRYDYVNDQILWVKHFPQPAYSRFVNIMQLPTDDHYVVIGMVENPSTSLDNLVMKVDKNNGNRLWIKTYQASGNTDISQAIQYYNGNLYLANVNRFGTGLDRIRPTISKFDLAGNQQWTNVYYTVPTGSARQYMIDLHVANDQIIGAGHGNLNGSTVTDYTIQLLSATINGSAVWAKDYHFAGNSDSYLMRRLLVLPDGYILLGNHRYNGTDDAFFLRTDLQGNALWAKSVGGALSDNVEDALFVNGQIYFTGSTANFDTESDVLFGTITIDGVVAGPGCEYVKDLEIIQTNLVNPYSGQANLTNVPVSYNLNDVVKQSAIVDMPEDFFPSCECQPADCKPSYLKTYGTLQGDDLCRALVPVPSVLGGGLLLGGSKGDSALLVLLNPEGDLIWTRTFDAVSNAADFIWNLAFDSDNNVIGVGNSNNVLQGDVESFAFKYNFSTNTILWINELNLSASVRENYRQIIEKTPGGNYIVIGETNDSGSTGCDALVIEMDRNTGVNVWQRNMHYGSCETYTAVIAANNGLYATGRFNFDGGGQARFRPGITKFDLSGNQLWTRWYLKGPSPTSARLYASAIVDDNGLVVFGQGDDNGTSTSQIDLHLFRTDYDGNLEWTMQYNIPGATTELSFSLVNLPDGYLCLGTYLSPDRNVFIFKTDKLGILQWSKTYGAGNGADESVWSMAWQNGQIYFGGNSKAPANGISEDIFIASISADGSSTVQDSCSQFSDLTVTQTVWQNPYDNQHNLTDLNKNLPQAIHLASMSETALQTNIECYISCLDSCHLLPEAVLQNVSAMCDSSGLLVTLEICNTGNFDLPSGVPVTFYDGDPTAAGATVVATLPLPEAVEALGCKTFELSLSGLPNTKYYILVNDDGTVAPPIDLTSYEGPQAECDFTNNLGSFQFDYTPPSLDLGPDILTCNSNSNTLDAGDNFAKYRWQDGSEEPVYTAYQPGTYWVDVWDICGFKQTDTVVITLDQVAEFDLGDDQFICEGDTVNLVVNGFPIVQWWPTDGLSCADCAATDVTPTTTLTYYATGRNGNCFSTDSILITVVPTPEITLETTAGDCTQTATTITASPVSGTTLDYVWSNGETGASIQVSQSGTYVVTATNATGCPVVDSVMVDVTTTELEYTSNVSPIPCFGETGSISLDISQAAQPVTILWSNGATEANLSGLSPDNYSVNITDANGCNATEEFILENPEELTTDPVASNISCNNDPGLIAVNTEGGTPPLTYAWSNGANTESIAVMTPGEYLATVTDKNGCSATIAQDIIAEVPLAVSILFTGIQCNGDTNGSAALYPLNGSAPYQYEWANGHTDSQLTGLGTEFHAVTITDAMGCRKMISFNLTEPDTISIELSATPVLCFGETNGSATAVASGGSPSYFYKWSNGIVTQTISNLSSGQYFVTVTDDHGCQDSAAVTVTEPLPVEVVATADPSEVCPNETADLSAAPSGGIPPYTYSWDNMTSDSILVNVPPGNYAVAMTDANGCEANGTVELGLASPAISIVDTIEAATGPDVLDGAITLETVLGGTPPFDFLWSQGSNTQSIQNLLPGAYSLTITDAMGCSEVFEFQVNFLVGTDQVDQLGMEISLFPNPTAKNGSADLWVKTIIPQTIEYWLYDVVGHLLVSKPLQLSTGLTQERLIAPDTAGVYILQIIDADGNQLFFRWVVSG